MTVAEIAIKSLVTYTAVAFLVGCLLIMAAAHYDWSERWLSAGGWLVASALSICGGSAFLLFVTAVWMAPIFSE